MSDAARIDVHQHLLPASYTAALDRHGYTSSWLTPAWSPGGAIAVMDQHSIATGVLSLSAPGVHLGDDREARTLAAHVNDSHAELVKDRPDRFGMFAALPLPDIDAALGTIAHAYDNLHTDGVVLLANSGGRYLGDPHFDPVMAELNQRKAIVFIHPTVLPGPPVGGIHPALADFLLDTTRAAMNLAIHGIPHRYPDLRIILSHAGGFVPYAAYRIAELAGVATGMTLDRAAVLESMSSFYFDTALSASPTALPSLLAFAKPGRILFGSDWPYAPESTVGYFTGNLDHHPELTQPMLAFINRRNALALFPASPADQSDRAPRPGHGRPTEIADPAREHETQTSHDPRR